MKQRISVLLRLTLSLLFILMVLEPVKALAPVEGNQVRLNLAVDDFKAFTSCDITDTEIGRDEILGSVQLLVSEDLLDKKIAQYKACDGVVDVDTDHFAQHDLIPTDPNYATNQFNLKNIGLESAWNITKGSPNIIVAVIDTGIDPATTLTDFVTGTIINGVSILTNETTYVQSIKADTYPGQYSYDGGSHGTAVASVIAAGMNTKTITGVAPGVKIMPIKVFRDEKTVNENVNAFSTDISKGIIWAVDHGARIINLSLGTYEYDYYLGRAVLYAVERNVIVVAASGNNADHANGYLGRISYPAYWDQVIAVGSITKDNLVSNFSSTDNGGLELVAYGENIWLPWNSENKYKGVNGTSFSAPTVSGVLALILSKYPNLNYQQARGALISGTTDLTGDMYHSGYEVGYDYLTGWGLVNAAKSLDYASKIPTTADPMLLPATAQSVELFEEINAGFETAGDYDMYCTTTYVRADLTFRVDPIDQLDVAIKIGRPNPDGSFNVMNGAHSSFFTIGNLEPGTYCVLINEFNGRTTANGGKYTAAFRADPVYWIPVITASTSAGTLNNGEMSFYPVQLNVVDSFKTTITTTRNGVNIATPSNLLFTDPGKYIVTIDDTRNDPVIFSFEVRTEMALTGFFNGRIYNKPVTVTFTADSATLDGQPLFSDTVIDTEGVHTLVFKVGDQTIETTFTLDMTAPVVTGLTEKYYLYETGQITFNEGTATLDKLPFTSGSVVTDHGFHTLTVTDPAGNVTTITFFVLDYLDKGTIGYQGHYNSIDIKVIYTNQTVAFYRLTEVNPITLEKMFIADFTGLSYTIPNVTDFNQSHTYEVQSCRSFTSETLCSEPYTVNAKTILDPVKFESTKINYKSFHLTWNAIEGATGYNILESGVTVGSTTSTSFDLVMTEPVDYFTYWHVNIVAYREVDGQKVLGSLSVQTEQSFNNEPQNPSNLKAVLEKNGSVTMSWDPVDLAAYYRLEVYNTTNWEKTIDQQVTGTSLNSFNLPAGVRAEIRVTTVAVFANGTVKPGYGSTSIYFETAPAKPKVTASSSGVDSITLSWPTVQGADGYNVFELNPQTSAFELVSAGLATTTITYKEKTMGVMSTYKVEAYRTVNGILLTGLVSDPVYATPSPLAPTGFKITKTGADYVSFSWDLQDKISGYEVWTSTTIDGTYILAATVMGGNLVTVQNLAYNTTHYFKMIPFVLAGDTRIKGPSSSILNTKTLLETLADFKVISTSYNENTLTWSPVPLASGYEVYYSIGTSTTLILLKSQTTTTLIHSLLLTNSKYNYKVRAYKLVGTVKVYGAYTSVLSSVPLPSAPKTTVVSTGYSSLKVTWPAVLGANGYEVSYATSENGTYTKLALLTTTTASISALLTNTTYFIKVRAYRIVNYVKIFGASTTVTGKPIPSTAVLTASSVAYNSLKLSWVAIAGASGYELFKYDPQLKTYMLLQTLTDLTYTDTGLTTGVSTAYKLKAYRLVGTTKVYSLDSTVISANAIPATVTGFKTQLLKYTELSLAWTAVTGATGYEISRSATLAGTYSFLSNIEGATVYTNTSLAFNTTYYYKIRPYTTVNGVKVFGVSSAAISGKTTLESATGPKAVSLSYNSNLITWNPVIGATGYEIYRSIGTSTTYTLLKSLTVTTYTNSLLSTNTKYNYKIRAYRLVGTVKIYGPFSVVTTSAPVPSNPLITVGSNGYNSLKVTWPIVAGANGYEVSYSTSETGTYTKLALVTTNSASIINLLTNTTYFVKVRAYRIVNYVKIYGAFSVIVTGTPIPATPVVTTVSAGFSSVKISWLAIAGANGYEVYAKSPESSDYVLIEDTTALTSTAVRLMTGSTYDFKVKAYRLVNSVRVYSAESAVKSAIPVPSLVTGFKVAMPSVTSLKLSWTAVEGATGYEVFKSAALAGTYVSLGTVEGNTEFNVTGLTFNTITYYKVRAYRTVDNVKVYGSSTTGLSGKTMPSTVVLKLINNYTTNTLSWPAIEGATGYEIYYSSGTSTYYTLLKSLTTTSFTHTPLVFNTQYNYKVRAYRLIGTVKYYGAYSALTSIKTAVSAPTAIVSSTHDSIGLTWNVVTGASGYEVSIATALTGPYTITTQTTVSKTFSGLTTGTTYYIKLRSYRLVSTTKVYGPYSGVITVTPKLEVPNIQLTGLTSTTATLSWAAVDGATDYEVRILSDAIGAEWVVESVSELTVTFSDLDPAAHYTVEIRAVKKVGDVPFYSEYSGDLIFSYSDTM